MSSQEGAGKGATLGESSSGRCSVAPKASAKGDGYDNPDVIAGEVSKSAAAATAAAAALSNAPSQQGDC